MTELPPAILPAPSGTRDAAANRSTLQWLLAEGIIDMRRGPLFDRHALPMPANMGFDKVAGMLVGLAVGDSLGNTSEGMTPADRRRRFGEIRDFRPNVHAEGRAVGLPSDDTQLAFWTLQQLLQDGGLDSGHLAERFCREQIFGIGSAVAEFTRNLSLQHLPWYLCGARSAGNGALMRIAPVLVPHLRTGADDLWVDAALCAMITHNDSASISACVAFVAILWDLLKMRASPRPDWWVDSFAAAAGGMESATRYRTRSAALPQYEGSLSDFARESVRHALGQGLSSAEACDSWHSGAYLLETVPSVLYVLARHGHDPEQAIVRAVNDTWDNDTIGAIVGAAVGALHGYGRLPERWTRGLLGRTGAGDDGQVFELIEAARRRWWETDCRPAPAEPTSPGGAMQGER